MTAEALDNSDYYQKQLNIILEEFHGHISDDLSWKWSQ